LRLVAPLIFPVVAVLPTVPTPAVGTTLVLSTNGHQYTYDGASWIDNGAAGGLGGKGLGVVDFGAVPGSTDALLVVTGQTGILAGSVVSVSSTASLTSDHSADEHWVDPPKYVAGNIVPGVGFTIYGSADSTRLVPTDLNAPFAQETIKQPDTAYGLWTVAWSWA
jgi:hypothetical protein